MSKGDTRRPSQVDPPRLGRERWPMPWRAGFDQEFARMQQMAGVMTIPQQQMVAAQQQAQAQVHGPKPGSPQADEKAQQQGIQDVKTAATQGAG